MVREYRDADRDLFEPLRPAKGAKLILAAVIGPLVWVVLWAIAGWLIVRSDAIELGLLVTVASFLIAFPILFLIHLGRNREERRFEEGPDGLEHRA